MSRVSEGAEGLFWRLILFADDFGRFDACAAVLKGALYPLRESVDSGGVLGWLRELHNEGCVKVYMAGGHEYGQLTGWEKHRSNQKRGKKSRLPGPTEDDSPASPDPQGLLGDPTPESCVLSPGGIGGVALPQGKSDATPVSESSKRCRRHLVAKLLALSPTHRVSRKTSFVAWDLDFDRLRRIDQRTEAEVIAMIDWALDHEFWCSVIQSPKNLREKWDQMELQRRRDRPALPSTPALVRAFDAEGVAAADPDLAPQR
jgi:hypothetical protein